MMNLNRRDFLKIGVAAGGSLLIPRWGFASATPTPDDPRFFLLVVLNGGADGSYLFDGRPLEMTKAGVMQNYIGEEPALWTGVNGTSCLATKLTAPLAPYKDHFSVLNGVLMATTFDGHPQNMNYLFTGNAFGGESFVPHFNLAATGQVSTAIDALQAGFIAAQIDNGASTISLDPTSAGEFSKRLRDLKPARPGDPLIDFIRSRLVANAKGSGRFSAGSSLMLDGLDRTADLHERLVKVQPPDPAQDDQGQFFSLLADYFRNGITRSAIVVAPGNFDVHAVEDAKAQPKLIGETSDRIARLLRALKETQYDSRRSLMDVTTFMVTTEFGRTMRQNGLPIDATGTNHNPLTNSVLVGGKGIRGGQVIGASDRATSSSAISGAHKSLDQAGEKIMGLPFDFKTSQPRTDQPAAFDNADYLTIASVVNTLYDGFNVPKSRYRLLGRAGTPAAPSITGLLS